MEPEPRIRIDPLKRNGKPCVRDLRMTVQNVLDCLGGGMTYEELLEAFPNLEIEDVHACLRWAASAERRLQVVGPG